MPRSLKLINKVLLMILFLMVVSGQACTAQTPPSIAKAKWTVMVYIAGDNELEEYVVPDIEQELAFTGSSAEVQVLALADRTPDYDTSRGDWQTTKLYHVTKGMIADSASAAADWGERNLGDPQTLIDFVSWTKKNYPAERYALYFWGHGWSWHPGWVMIDDTDNDTFDYDEMRSAIPSLGYIDVVGYDGCNMASIEMLNLWHGYSTALTSSQEYVEGYGIEYDILLTELIANPNMTADELAIATSRSASHDVTWSAMAVDSRLDTLLSAVDDWSEALTRGLSANRANYDRAFESTQSFWEAPMDKDLYDMAYELDRNVADPEIRAKSQAVMEAVNRVVLYEFHENEYNDAHGITIYHISAATEKDSDYSYYRSTIDFSLQNAWDEFLDEYAK